MVAAITAVGSVVDLVGRNLDSPQAAGQQQKQKSGNDGTGSHEIELGIAKEGSSSSRGSSPRAGGSWEDIRATQVLGAGAKPGYGSEKSAPAESEDEEMVNGQEVKEGMDRWGWTMGARASISALAFAMGVVGIWGDGY